MDTIKCGRITYKLSDGETIMDNGACIQLLTRRVSNRWTQYPPKVSKKAFEKFKKNKNVEIETDHKYDETTTLWVYRKPAI